MGCHVAGCGGLREVVRSMKAAWALVSCLMFLMMKHTKRLSVCIIVLALYYSVFLHRDFCGPGSQGK